MPVKQTKEILGKDLYTQLKEEKNLTLKQIKFVGEYLSNGLNQTRAYLTVYYKGNESKYASANAQAPKLLVNVSIKEAIKTVLDLWLGATKLKLEQKIIDSLYREAFYDPSMFITETGAPKFKKLEDIDVEWRPCIVGIETKSYGKDAVRDHTVVKLADRRKAREELSKYIELIKGSDISVGLTDETLQRLAHTFGGKKKK